ncbi:MAG: HlyC/CorC family transporter [Bacteroidetes bacterium]|nr:MAG: HlyC/CorC family transporter [Bacteroidota bacterium]
MDSEHFIIIASLLFSAFCSGVEIAFISSSRLKIELDKNKGNFNGRIAAFFYEQESHFIATLLLCNNISLVIFGIYFAKLLQPTIAHWGVEQEALILLIQTILSTLLVLILAEFFPKAIFQLHPNRFLKAVAVPMWSVYWLLYLPTSVIVFFSSQILKLFHIEMTNTEKVFSKVDLEHYVQDLNRRLKEEEDFGNEMQILQNALDFSKIKARDCMVPRTELIAMDISASVNELHALFVKTGISKILIYRDHIDNIIGYVHAFELFKKPKEIHEVLRSIAFVPSAIPGKELMEMFTQKSSNIAIVLDEYGGTAGVVTIEDVIEEIFGDIEDEHDREEWLEEKLGDREFRFSGRLEIDYLNEQYKLNFEESEEYGTLGGLILDELESIPEAGTEIEVGKYRLLIEEVSDRRIEIVKLTIEE